MMLVICLPCALALRVMPAKVADAHSLDELETLVGRKSPFWPDKFPCPRCDQSATGMGEREADPRALHLMELIDLTPQEAFAAFNGVGLPEEQRCSLTAVEQLLKTHPVRRVIGRDVQGLERTVVDALELWDGTKLHFGSGADGAVVYRIVRPPAYAARVLEEGTPP